MGWIWTLTMEVSQKVQVEEGGKSTFREEKEVQVKESQWFKSRPKQKTIQNFGILYQKIVLVIKLSPLTLLCLLTMTDQKFVGDFIASLGPFQNKLDDNFEGTHIKPVVLENMIIDLKPLASQPPQSVSVSLRSIRSPKFSVEYTVPDTDTIFALKERLLTDPNGPLAGSEYNLGGIKLMIKSRAISDTRQIREVSGTEFTVMLMTGAGDAVPSSGQLYWSETSEIAPNVPKIAHQEAEEPVAAAAASPKYPPEMWEEISAVVSKYNSHSAEIVAKFRRAVE